MDIENSPDKRKTPTPSTENEHQEEFKKLQKIRLNPQGKRKKEPPLESRD